MIRATIYTAPNPFITKNDLPIGFMGELAQSLEASDQYPVIDIQNITTKNMSLADWEKHGIKAALAETEGNITAAAKRLGITRTTLYKATNYGLKSP